MKWITATDLDLWAETIPARVEFPGLVADLIRASVTDISCFRFPRGDKGQVRGFDGVLEAESNCTFIPDGESVWEFGVTEGGAAKASADYKKRTEQVDKAMRKNTTFVFASLRTWDPAKGSPKREDWVKEKCDLKEWKDVWYIDGSMLEEWLSDCPAVAARYAKHHLNKMPLLGVRSTDEFWEEFSTRFAPQLVEKVLLAGREDQAKNLVQQLSGGPNRLLYAADAPDEVVVFAIAAIRSADPGVRIFLESKTLVVDSEDAARQLANKKGLVFLLKGQGRDFVGLLSQRGPTLVSAGADEKRQNHVLLNRPRSSELAEAFVAMGYEQHVGYDLARRCGRSLAVLARLIPSGNAKKPAWVESGEQLLPALLAGAWRSSIPPDTDVLRALADTADYETLESPLRRLARLQDPPVDRVGDVWAMRASVDAFIHLAPLLGPKHLERFATVAKAVFSRIGDPPKANEVFKPSSEREVTHSDWLRDGLMTTLLHMAVLHEQAEFTVNGSSPIDFVNNIVRELPGLSRDHRLLAALQDQLALLAEAAPVPFLEALEHLLEGDASGIKPIFEEFAGLITSSAYHYGVLWALEVVAWDPSLLLRAAVCLARLAAIDPGGTDSNRPINSLRAIFLSWSPNTTANAAERIGVLTNVVETVPDIAWQLLTKLLPKAHDSSSPTERPKFREYGDGIPEVLTYGLVWGSQTAVIRLALARVGHDPGRWATIIDALHQFPEAAFHETVDALGVEMATSHEGSVQIWDHLRKEVNRHIAFSGADWALRDEVLARLDELVTKHAPKNPVLLLSWLFDDWMPDIPEKADSDDPMAGVEEARAKAIADVYGAAGVAGLVELASKAKLPDHVAYALKTLQLGKDALVEVLRRALHSGEALHSFAAVVIAEAVRRFGKEGEAVVRSELLALGLAPDRVARLLMTLPDGKQTWLFVATFGEAVEEAYWQGKHSFFIDGGVDALYEAIANYARRGRFLGALDASSQRLKDVPTPLLMELLQNAISEINAQAGAGGNMAVYLLERTFDELRLRTDVPLHDIAQLEFAYLPIFRMRKKPLVLHRLMAEQASLFVEVVTAVFKPEHGDAPPVDEGAKQLATAAYGLLDGLNTLPGQADDRIDVERLLAWCLEVRELAAKADRLTMAEQRMGYMFARAPTDPVDGAWPHEAVRVAIERMASDPLERGLAIARVNLRGVYSKEIGEGGKQERELAAEALGWAQAMPAFPRTAAMLRRISENWTRYAEQADVEAQADALKW